MNSSQSKSRKRSLPHSLAEENRKAPPNVKVTKLTKEVIMEKEKLLRQSEAESNREFHHQPLTFLSHLTKPPVNQFPSTPIGIAPAYPFLTSPLASSSTRQHSNIMSGLSPTTTIDPALTARMGSYGTPSYQMSYPFPTSTQPFKVPQGFGVVSPFNPLQNEVNILKGSSNVDPTSNQLSKNRKNSTNCSDSRIESACDKQPSSPSLISIASTHRNDVIVSTNCTTSCTTQPTNSNNIYPYVFSPLSSHLSSPFFYMYNRSPLSPMMYIGSPCAPPSVNSCPSVSSSSGCSSMSEGSHTSIDLTKDGSQTAPRIAPTEYHVGIMMPQNSSRIDCGNECDSNQSSPINKEPAEEIELVTDKNDADVEGEQDTESHSGCLSKASSGIYSTAVDGISSKSSGSSDGTCPLSGQSVSRKKIEESSRRFLSQFPPNSHSIERPSSGISSFSSPSSSRGSTPEPEENDPPDQKSTSFQSSSTDDELFCLVPGRLSLLSATQKYRVSLDEVRRRLSNPECLNASVLGGILRRAKSKNGGHHLRQRLEAKGLSLPAGRRKAAELSLLTSLVEGEALHLAEDFRRLCENAFPHTELAQIIGAQHINTPHVDRRISMVQAAQVLIQELQAMVNTVGGPTNLRPDDPSNPYPGLTNFSLLSHGFGNPNISAVLSVIQNYFNELLGVYDGKKSMMNLPYPGVNHAPSQFARNTSHPTIQPDIFSATMKQPFEKIDSLQHQGLSLKQEANISCHRKL